MIQFSFEARHVGVILSQDFTAEDIKQILELDFGEFLYARVYITPNNDNNDDESQLDMSMKDFVCQYLTNDQYWELLSKYVDDNITKVMNDFTNNKDAKSARNV